MSWNSPLAKISFHQSIRVESKLTRWEFHRIVRIGTSENFTHFSRSTFLKREISCYAIKSITIQEPTMERIKCDQLIAQELWKNLFYATFLYFFFFKRRLKNKLLNLTHTTFLRLCLESKWSILCKNFNFIPLKNFWSKWIFFHAKLTIVKRRANSNSSHKNHP